MREENRNRRICGGEEISLELEKRTEAEENVVKRKSVYKERRA